MKKLITIILLFILCATPDIVAFSRTQHDAIAYIAECHLTKKAKRNIEHYLGHSIVYDASWMDNYRKTPEYLVTDKWHTGSVDANLQSTKEIRIPNKDCVEALENAIDLLKNYKDLNDSTVNVNLKYVIHLTGDMHCPSHVKYTDRNSFNVKLKGKEVSYHSVWDSGMLNAAHAWGYMEYRHQLDRCSKKERKEISKGTPAEWFHETAVDCRVIYDWASPNAELDVDFVNQAHALGEQQILKAGYRLARILNELFG